MWKIFNMATETFKEQKNLLGKKDKPYYFKVYF